MCRGAGGGDGKPPPRSITVSVELLQKFLSKNPVDAFIYMLTFLIQRSYNIFGIFIIHNSIKDLYFQGLLKATFFHSSFI